MSISRLFLVIILGCFFSQAQAPPGINYQAAVRDSDGILYDNDNLTVYFRLITLETGNIVWEEVHNVQTNDFGVFSTIIGYGDSTSLGVFNNFEDINWGEGSIFMKIDIDFDNDGPSQPVSFGESQLLSVPYALYSNSSGNNHWEIIDGTIEPQQDLSINLSSDNTHITSDNILLGGENNSIINVVGDVQFYNNDDLLLEFINGEINSYQQINSVEPSFNSHLTTKNYVDSRDDNIVLQMNSAFEENINFFQSQINSVTNQVSSIEENVNQNSEAYYSLQDILSANDENLQEQVDVISTILQTLEDNINTNLSLQNQINEIQIQINSLTNSIQELQDTITE